MYSFPGLIIDHSFFHFCCHGNAGYLQKRETEDPYAFLFALTSAAFPQVAASARSCFYEEAVWGALGGGTPPPVRAAAGPFGACGAKASAPRMRIPIFVSGHPGTRLQEPLLFLPPYICCKSFPVVSHKRRGAFYSPSFLRSEWKDQKSFVCVS